MLANFVLWRRTTPFCALAARRPRRPGAQAPRHVRAALEGDAGRRSTRHRAVRRRRRRCGDAPSPRRSAARRAAAVLGDPDRRRDRPRAARTALRRRRADGPRATVAAALAATRTRRRFDVWHWLTIRAGVPVITAATQDQFVAQTANWDVLGGVSFQQGLLHRAGDRRPDAVPRPAEGTAVPVPRADGRRRGRRAPLFSASSASSPAAPSSTRPPRPRGGATCSPCCSSPPPTPATSGSARPTVCR